MASPKDDSYPTRSSLLARLKDTADQRSWQQFNDTYSRLIFGFALKAGLTETEAEEVVQDVFAKVCEASERAVKADGRNVSLFPGFHFNS